MPCWNGGGWVSHFDTKITGKAYGKLDIAVYCKQTHRDRYMYPHLRSHHPTHVNSKVSLRPCQVHCTAGTELRGPPHESFNGNSYPCSFIHSAFAARAPMEDNGEREEEKLPTLHLPYIAGFSERTRRVCKDFNIRGVFKSGPTLHSLLKKSKTELYGEASERCLRSID